MIKLSIIHQVISLTCDINFYFIKIMTYTNLDRKRRKKSAPTLDKNSCVSIRARDVYIDREYEYHSHISFTIDKKYVK
jgi:hypothetical protein